VTRRHRQVGDAPGLERSLEYALGHRVPEKGDPAWVVPLASSHAMLLLATRPELELVRSQNGFGVRSHAGLTSLTAWVS